MLDEQERIIKDGSLEPVQKTKNLTIDIQNVKKDLVSYWTKEYINQAINECEDYKKKVYCTFLFRTGLRVTESINVRKKDFDFKNNLLKIRWLKNRKYHHRMVPLHQSLVMMLELYLSTINQEDKVFPWSRNYSYQVVQEVLGGNPHKLRHSFAVHWLKSGLDLYILSKVLGHSSIRTTEKHYLNIVPLDQGRELNKVEF